MRAITAFLALIYPLIGWAEVMDKEFSFPTVLAWGALGVIGTFAAARWFPWALAAVLPPVAVFFFAHLSELLDPYVGPAILKEAGLAYVTVSWFFPVLIILALVTGLRVRHGIRRAAT